MTQLVVTIEDVSLLADLKKAIKMLRGVGDISVRKEENADTLSAIQDVREGRTIKCNSFDEYLEMVYCS